MNYKLIPLKDFKKFIKKRTPKERETIDTKLSILSDDINSIELDIKKLKGSENRFRLRIGKYRILYEVYEDELIIILADAGSRGDVYK
jgi:mRNA interferase RelE/StbE